MQPKPVCLIIPSYNPTERLIEILYALTPFVLIPPNLLWESEISAIQYLLEVR